MIMHKEVCKKSPEGNLRQNMGRNHNSWMNNQSKINRLKWSIICVGCLFLLFLICRTEYDQSKSLAGNKEKIGVEETISMLSFTPYSIDDWKKILDYEKDRKLRYRDVKKIIENLGVTEYITYTQKGDSKIIERADWNKIYDQILGLLDVEGKVKKNTYLILKSDGQKGEVVTQEGTCHVSIEQAGLQERMAYQCYVYEGNIIGVAGICKEDVMLPNVYVTGVEQKTLSFLYGGNFYQTDLENVVDGFSGVVCDLHYKNGAITGIDKKQETITGNLLTLDENKIEIEGYGQLKRQKALPVYQTYGTVAEKSISDIVIGNMNVTYVVAKDEVCAILLNQPANLSNIRVLLLNGKSVYREQVRITCDAPFSATCGDTTVPLEAGTVFDPATVLNGTTDGYVRVDDANAAELFLTDENGKRISYGYDGTFEVRHYEEGYIVINDVPIEQYLYQVVTSEMPSGYQVEALKAQAVCARSYAYRQLLQSNYAMYGAHVDDSTNYQTYNKQEHTEIAKTVVDATCGEIMDCNGEIVEAFYFSTSCGTTENDHIWGDTMTTDYPFLKTIHVAGDAATPAFSDETVFYQYITGKDDSCFDHDSHYFRWNTTAKLTEEDAEAIRGVITTRKEIKPENIVITDLDGKEKDNMSGMGNLLAVRTNGRANSGAVLELLLSYENGKVHVKTEYNIRRVLGCMVGKIHLCDGTSVEDVTLLPSVYFTMGYDEATGTYPIYGGGYGHGVGMSQNAAEGMAKQGYSYRDILNFFFQNITIQMKG